MVNALEPSDLSALHSRVRKFEFHLQSGGRGASFSKRLLLGEGQHRLPIPTSPLPIGTSWLSRQGLLELEHLVLGGHPRGEQDSGTKPPSRQRQEGTPEHFAALVSQEGRPFLPWPGLRLH